MIRTSKYDSLRRLSAANSHIVTSVLSIVTLVSLLAGAFAPLHGQALGTSTVAVDSAVAFTLATAPEPGSWRVSTTAGFRFDDGRADTRGYSLGVNATYTSQASILWRFEADWQRSEARPTSESPMYVLDDTRFAALSATKMLGSHIGVMATGSWRQDRPLELDRRLMAQVGPLLAIANRRTLSIATVPVIGLGQQDNALGSSSESITHIGGVQTLTWHASPYTQVQAYVVGHRVIDNADDYSFTVNASISGALSRNLGINLFYRLYEEGIQPPGVARRQHTLGAGFKLVFPSLAAGG